MSNLFCKIGGKEIGPLSPDQVKEMAAAGDLGPGDLVRRETDQDWVPARRLKTLTFNNTGRRIKKPPLLADMQRSTRPPDNPHRVLAFWIVSGMAITLLIVGSTVVILRSGSDQSLGVEQDIPHAARLCGSCRV